MNKCDLKEQTGSPLEDVENVCILVDGSYTTSDIDDCNSSRLEDTGSIPSDDCPSYKDVTNRFPENTVPDGSRVDETDSGSCVTRSSIPTISRLW